MKNLALLRFLTTITVNFGLKIKKIIIRYKTVIGTEKITYNLDQIVQMSLSLAQLQVLSIKEIDYH
jgi:hypothetical protein